MFESVDIQEPLRALRRAGVIPDAGTLLAARRPALDDWLRDRILAEVAAYSVTTNPDIAPRLKQHTTAIADSLQACFSEILPSSAPDIAEHARWCADRKFPLEAILLGYAAIQQDLLNWLRDAALEAADPSAQVPRVVADLTKFVIKVNEQHTAIATAEYVAHTRAVAEAEGDRRTKLAELLLHGYDESDSRAARLLRRSGYLAQRQGYCVVIARPVDIAEMQNAARAQRLRDAISNIADQLHYRSLITTRDAQIVAIVSRTRRISGWTPQQADIANELRQPLRRLSNMVISGVSNDAPSTSHIAGAYREASLALELASVSNRVSFYKDIPLRRMLVHTARDEVAASLPIWAETLGAEDSRTRGKIAATLQAYADASMNTQQAAKVLGAHPNTLYSRFQKIHDATGKNPLVFHDLNELLFALDCRAE